MFVLLTISGSTYAITEKQRDAILAGIDANSKAFRIGDSFVMAHQITEITPLETYKRHMKMKLSPKKLRMCGRCATVLSATDPCPCKEQPEKYQDIMTVARQENPALAAELDALAEAKSIPQLSDGK